MSFHSPPNPRWKIIPPSENGKFDMLAPSFIHCKQKNNNNYYNSRNVCKLKCAQAPINDIISSYSTCIRPVMEYCAPVFHHALPI